MSTKCLLMVFFLTFNSARHLIINKSSIQYTLSHKFKHVQVEDAIIDIQQVEYYINVQIGGKKQNFQILIDTGSSDLWVPEVGAQGFDELSQNEFYDCENSSTCDDTEEEIQVDYDDGPIVGHIAWDQIRFNDNKSVLKHQSLLLINNAEDNMQNGRGLMGLSFQGISQNPNPTVLSTMVANKIIASKMFSLYLTDKGTEGSRIIFGGVDNKYLMDPKSGFIYAKLISTLTYSIGIKGLKIGSQLFKMSTALVDSGTSCITIPAPAMDSIKSSFLNQGVKCKFLVEKYATAYSMMQCQVNAFTSEGIIKSFPSIFLVIDDKQTLELMPQDYIFSCKVINKTMQCMTKLERSDQDNILLLGDAFLQSFYTIFDQDKKQLGFGHSINNGVIVINDGLIEQEIEKGN